MSNKIDGNETVATKCGKWPDWLHDAVDNAIDVSDRLDWSTEQVLAYAILCAYQKEREECVKIVEAYADREGVKEHNNIVGFAMSVSARDISQAIRSRK